MKRDELELTKQAMGLIIKYATEIIHLSYVAMPEPSAKREEVGSLSNNVLESKSHGSKRAKSNVVRFPIERTCHVADMLDLDPA